MTPKPAGAPIRSDTWWMPEIESDPSWCLVFGPEASVPRVRETLCTVANGVIGTRGSAEEEPPGSDPLVVASGVYDDSESPALLPGPRWTSLRLDLPAETSDIWTLDMWSGLLWRRSEAGSDTLRTLRFHSITRPECAVLRAEAPHASLHDPPPLVSHQALVEPGDTLIATSSRGAIVATARDRVIDESGHRLLERLAAYVPNTGPVAHPEPAGQVLDRLTAIGSDRLLAEHRRAWASRWQDAATEIVGDSEAQIAVRFALFHLMSSAGTLDESAIGARGLSGRAYRGHVFWDTEVFVLPVLAATIPAAARAALEYRIRRLPAARLAASRQGAAGARFPWESADSGEDVTPGLWTSPDGEVIPVKTGMHEEHIIADVAWAARHYASWTGDDGFLTGPGRDLVLDTARYWASRIRVDESGRGHLDGVIGPDEYHPVVDDNAYTNVMARANLRWAAALAGEHGGAGPTEIEGWHRLANCLIDGYDKDSGCYEQFAGYSDLEPLLIADLAPPPIAADVLIGQERVARTQLIKQADVLMLHHMVPDEVETGSLLPNLVRYLPRTAHGSSLSPAVHASLLARAGEAEEALKWFRIAARLDLDDLTGTTAGGLHLATMGGVWQALVFGFLGVKLGPETIHLDPRLPGAWDSVSQRMVVRGAHLGIAVAHDEVQVESDRPIQVTCSGTPYGSSSTVARFRRRGDEWEKA